MKQREFTFWVALSSLIINLPISVQIKRIIHLSLTRYLLEQHNERDNRKQHDEAAPRQTVMPFIADVILKSVLFMTAQQKYGENNASAVRRFVIDRFSACVINLQK